MSGKTISGTITKTVTLGSAKYPLPLTVTSTGIIDPSGASATGIYLPAVATFASITNHGTVFGGFGSYNSDFVGGAGGDAAVLSSGALFNNTNLVAGGAGGTSDNGGAGGIGIYVDANATIVNSGTVAGGASGYGRYGTGAGGSGVDLATHATLINTGKIFGGNADNAYDAITSDYGGRGVTAASEGVVINNGIILGGAGGISGSATISGATGKSGVKLSNNSTLSNTGNITGGAGGTGANVQYGGGGGVGVAVGDSTAANTGFMIGGAGGQGSFTGGTGGAGAYVYNYGILTNKDLIEGGGGGTTGAGAGDGGSGGFGLEILSFGTVTNTYHILGGNGGRATAFYGDGGSGGDGAYINAGVLTNAGAIAGGNGGATAGAPSSNKAAPAYSGGGGTGLAVETFFSGEAASVSNTGTIVGGTAGYVGGYGGDAGTGGFGVVLLGSSISMTNAGTIVGGTGGYAGQGALNYGTGGVGGAGLVVEYGARASNSGTIIGGTGGANVYTGYAGGTGVAIYGGTFVDSGLVEGGAGGDTQGRGASGLAVYVYGTTAGTLVLNPGASFVGAVEAVASVANVLEVAGSSGTALKGIGTEFTGFADVSFASGATRAIEGTITALAHVTGFASHDSIILDGYSASPDASQFSTTQIGLDDAGVYTYLDIPTALAKDILVEVAGGKTTLIGASGNLAHTIATGTAQFVLNHGTGTGTLIKTGGYEEIFKGGTGAKTTIGGGTLKLDIGSTISGGIGFSTVTGGTLVIESATLPTATISGFIAGDTIALAGIAYNKNDTVTVATAGTVSIVTPGMTYKLDVAGATVGESDFRFGAGSRLTRTAAKTMTFLAAPDRPQEAPLVPARLTLQDFAAAAPALAAQPHEVASHTIAHGAGTLDVAALFRPEHAVIPHTT